MATYKVPQDVEADDKLLGPFSFRQFIYLLIVAGGIGIAWVLSRVLVPLAILPLPVILFFGALALPLRKDQPMETYLAAMVSFYLKPRKRTWDPDGLQSLIEITAPRIVETVRTKDLSQTEADKRFSYLANIVDSRGWAVRGVDAQPNSSMNADVYFEAQQTEDMLDTSTRTAHSIESQLDQTNQRRHQELLDKMRQPQPVQPTPVAASTPVPVAPTANPYANLTTPTQAPPTPTVAIPQHLTINPYPTMQQTVIQPLSSTTPAPQQPPQAQPQPTPPPVEETTSEKPISPDIINLANNPDLSIETIAHEANRIKEKEGLPSDEVMISLH